MNRPGIYSVLVCCAFLLVDRAEGISTRDLLYRRESAAPEKIVVELLIICDKEFGDLFNHDRLKMVDYWAIQMWDLNMRFKTLRKSDISFKVNQLIAFNDTSEQSFIEEARADNGSLVLHNALVNTSMWTYTHRKSLTEFDIAVLATAADKVEKESTNYPYGHRATCVRTAGVDAGALVLHFENPWGNPCSQLEQGLAELIGALPDEKLDAFTECDGKGYLQNRNACGKKHYFFSHCSDDGISKFTKSYRAYCLHTVDSPTDDVIATYASVTHPPSFPEQCKLLTNDTNAVLGEEEDKCIMLKCYIPENGNLALGGVMYPFDNSPCGDFKFCFRGRCLPTGHQLRNVGTRKCLYASNRFSSNDNLILADCVESPTQLDQFRISESDDDTQGKLLAAPYSSPDASENTDKCLSVDTFDERLQFKKCSFDDKKWLNWNVIKVDESREEFFLYHPHTKRCAGVDKEGIVRPNLSCDKNDTTMLWKLHDRPLPTHTITKRSAEELYRATSFKVVTENHGRVSLLKTSKTNMIFIVLGSAVGIVMLYALRNYRVNGKGKHAI